MTPTKKNLCQKFRWPNYLRLAIVLTLSSCSWFIPTFFPQNMDPVPPAPARDFYCLSPGWQVLAPSPILGEALQKYLIQNPQTSVSHAMRLLLLSSMQVIPQAIGPTAQYEILENAEGHWQLLAGGKLPDWNKLFSNKTGHIFNNQDLNFLATLPAVPLSPELAAIITKAKFDKQSTDELSFYQKKNLRALNQGDPLGTISWKELLSILNSTGPSERTQLIITAESLGPETNFQCAHQKLSDFNLQDYVYKRPSKIMLKGASATAEKTPEPKISGPPIFIPYLSAFAVVDPQGRMSFALVGQALAPVPRVWKKNWPFFQGAPLPLGHWCWTDASVNKPNSQVLMFFNHPDISYWSNELAQMPALSGPAQLSAFIESARHIMTTAPPRMLVEADRMLPDQLKDILRSKLPIYYQNDLGVVLGGIQNESSGGIVDDSRWPIDVVCPK